MCGNKRCAYEASASEELEMCKRRVLMLQWKIYHFSSDFRANKRKFKLSSRSRASDTFQKNFFFPGTATRCRRRGKIWEKEAFCDDSTVKNLPFFKRFPKFFLEIDSWMQAPLSGCVISIQFCPWYRKLVLKVNLAWFQAKIELTRVPARWVWDFSLNTFRACVCCTL